MWHRPTHGSLPSPLQADCVFGTGSPGCAALHPGLLSVAPGGLKRQNTPICLRRWLRAPTGRGSPTGLRRGGYGGLLGGARQEGV